MFTSILKSSILLSKSVLGNRHLGPHSPCAVRAILGALRFPGGDVCCWVNLQLRPPRPPTSDDTERITVRSEGWGRENIGENREEEMLYIKQMTASREGWGGEENM